MLNIFKRKNEADAETVAEPVDPEVTEHQAFAKWLDNQPDDRKKMYLNLAMAYGFRMHGENAASEGEAHE